MYQIKKIIRDIYALTMCVEFFIFANTPTILAESGGYLKYL